MRCRWLLQMLNKQLLPEREMPLVQKLDCQMSDNKRIYEKKKFFLKNTFTLIDNDGVAITHKTRGAPSIFQRGGSKKILDPALRSGSRKFLIRFNVN